MKATFDPGDRDICQTLCNVVSIIHRSAEQKMLEGNLSGARKDVLKSYQIITGMNPVRPFVRECVKRVNGCEISTNEAFALFERRVRLGLEIPIKKGVFSASFRRAVDEEFCIHPSSFNGKLFKGVQLYDR